MTRHLVNATFWLAVLVLGILGLQVLGAASGFIQDQYYNNSGMSTLSPSSMMLTGVLETVTFFVMIVSGLKFVKYYRETPDDGVFYAKLFIWSFVVMAYPVVAFKTAWNVSFYINQRLGSEFSNTRFAVVWLLAGGLVLLNLRDWKRQFLTYWHSTDTQVKTDAP